MWLPDVMTSTPFASRDSAVDGVRPMPPATFSPLAVTKSMPRSSRRLGQQRLDGGPAGLADEVADHQDAAGAGRARRVAVGRVAEAGAPERGREWVLHAQSLGPSTHGWVEAASDDRDPDPHRSSTIGS